MNATRPSSARATSGTAGLRVCHTNALFFSFTSQSSIVNDHFGEHDCLGLDVTVHHSTWSGKHLDLVDVSWNGRSFSRFIPLWNYCRVDSRLCAKLQLHAGTEALHMHYRHRGRCWVFLSRVPPLMAFVSAFVGASPTLPDVTTVGRIRS